MAEDKETVSFEEANRRLLSKLMGWLMHQPEWSAILAMPRDVRKAAQREVIKAVYRLPNPAKIARLYEQD